MKSVRFAMGWACFATLFAPALLHAANETAALTPVVVVNQDVRSLGEPLTVSITNGPAAAANAQVRLAREGKTYTVVGAYAPPGDGKSAGLFTAPKLESDDAKLPLVLGKYLVTVELDGVPFAAPVTKKLEIVTPGNPELRLDAFEPASTDKKREAFFDDSPKEKKAGNPKTEFRRSKVVNLVLRGAGFQENLLDNFIYINRRQVAIVAGEVGDCAKPREQAPAAEAAPTFKDVDAPAENAEPKPRLGEPGAAYKPVRRVIIARYISSNELLLCLVPVPKKGELLVQVRVGDRISSPQMFLVYSLSKVYAAGISFLVALLLGLIPLLLLNALKSAYTVGPNKHFKMKLLFVDQETDTYSLSKLQFYMWTLAALFGYTYLFIGHVFVQGLVWPDVPGTLPGIIAFSAGTSIGAQIINSTRGSKGAGETEPSLADFVTSGGVVAADRVQMLVWTIFGVGAFIVSILYQAPSGIQTLPTIPEGLMYLMGLSSLGYLGGKLARKAGPVINEISMTPAEPDDAIASAGMQGIAEPPDLRPAIAEARGVRATLGVPTNTLAVDAVKAVDDAIGAATSAHTTLEINTLVTTLIQLRATAEKRATDLADSFAAETDPARKAATAKEAAIAQAAAALLQDFSADITQAISVAGASPMLTQNAPTLITRVITLRGTGLSPEGILEIDKADLPFRMLSNSEGKQQPDVLAREEAAPTLARMLKLTIDPKRLGEADLAQLSKWFASPGRHTFTLTNPDGQKAELTFAVPPGAAQK